MESGQLSSGTCCIVGGGPAGMMLGYLLARAGIEVLVLEKHADFLRDFRGDTVHPSTLEVMHELGVLEDFLKRPHQQIRRARGNDQSTVRLTHEFRNVAFNPSRIADIYWSDFIPKDGAADWIAPN